MLKNTMFVAMVGLAQGVGCKKDKKDGGGGGTSDKPTETTPAGPLVFTSPALWAEYNSGKYQGMDLVDHYKPGVKVTGKIVRQMGGEPDSESNYSVWTDVDG